jgi:hypothetical protein
VYVRWKVVAVHTASIAGMTTSKLGASVDAPARPFLSYSAVEAPNESGPTQGPTTASHEAVCCPFSSKQALNDGERRLQTPRNSREADALSVRRPAIDCAMERPRHNFARWLLALTPYCPSGRCHANPTPIGKNPALVKIHKVGS